MNAAIELEHHRTALTGHCYRMLGSIMDADDAVQETMVRAWRSLDRFEGRSSLRRWLVRIATHVCLDALQDRSRRARPFEDYPRGTVDDALVEHPASEWIEPAPAAAVLPTDADVGELAILRESVRLAFVAALQHLPPKQRAALLLTEVLGWSAAETADALTTSVAAIHSALQRARATLATRAPQPTHVSQVDADNAEMAELVDAYVAAFERYDVDQLAALLCRDAILSMPPFALWLQGPDAIRAWLLGHGIGCRGSRLIPTSGADGHAFGQYRLDLDGVHRAWALIVLELADGRIATWNAFLDTPALFPRFGLPLVLADSRSA